LRARVESESSKEPPRKKAKTEAGSCETQPARVQAYLKENSPQILKYKLISGGLTASWWDELKPRAQEEARGTPEKKRGALRSTSQTADGR